MSEQYDPACIARLDESEPHWQCRYAVELDDDPLLQEYCAADGLVRDAYPSYEDCASWFIEFITSEDEK